MGFQDVAAGGEKRFEDAAWPEAIDVKGSETSKKSINAWMEALDVDDKETEGNDNLQDSARIDPSTPPPSCRTFHQYVEEVSPTDTNFSFDPIFGSPIGSFDLSGNYTPNRERYAATDASSVDDDDEATARKELLASLVAPADGAVVPGSHLNEALSSDLATAVTTPLHATSEPVPDPAHSTFNRNTTHLIWVTACLQCVLADLPCSRTLPACSRCVRNGHGEVCLVQRQRVHEEIVHDHYICDPILLVREGDDDAVYEKKEALQGDMIESWREKYDRNFWYPSGKKFEWGATHPGFGEGSAVPYRVKVKKWHPNLLRERL
ncbi:hypothetical protein BU23DRAFT_599759 [Bimuria novae-zelandiae CBS 107.79]|uniref:Zn(2)-C6 fungal-type domain-containing protein n=1 Tax=Bimuria novae-zelandiae CBS 107.79 TaxID=1447943 RepID=A0A6A5V5Y3_9PLEO|nr:hypothetical protein BU23DRAFT_599759 [Bimuria novae-zelandiae CBS 107.79]